ncbi:hypothetical protein CFC21_081214 [Triticum aestivum]|uniref:Fe2OG dioxygenase domain-containing protein n=2 Tax=Triticum aestivum TaxID=4565 RepID=A0A3B6N300_WHEAT|nr:hypothetical protein CFC21_081214 [Triticum aestivum]
MASDSDHERLRALKAFDDTKAGVKGLVDAGVTAIPAIFHHPPDSLADAPHHHGHHQFAIPVIDLAGLATPSGRASVVGAVRAAAETVGFFQVTNHGVPESAMSETLAAVRRFNEEPAEAKAPYYSRDPAVPVQLRPVPVAGGRLARHALHGDGPGATAAGGDPAGVPGHRAGVHAAGAQALRAAVGGSGPPAWVPGGHRRVPGRAERGLPLLPGVPGAAPDAGHREALRPQLPHRAPPGRLGGLQVLLDDDEWRPAWVDVPAEAGALVVNVGDYLQILSNDRFRSVEHRVVANGAGPRVSVACFFRADASTRVLAPIVTAGDTARYRSTTVPDYGAKGLDGVSALQRVRI